MKTILVINAGSASLKYKLFEAKSLRLLQKHDFQNVKSYQLAFKKLVGQIKEPQNIIGVGHRVVHGGTKYFYPTVITDRVMRGLEKISHLAPLHNPYNLLGIKISRRYFPKVPDIACFDTGFFVNLPDKAKIYALPLKFYKKYKIQRFGFHGLSHQYVAMQAAKKLKKPFSKLKIITCHLGGGCSITAINKGRPVETSMGFTPLEGLVMMSRSGDLDAGIILHLLKSKNYRSSASIIKLLNFESGMKGLVGTKNFLEVLRRVQKGNRRAKLAFDIFIHRIQKYIGAYFAILGGLDVLVFTGAIGAGKPITRQQICKNLKILKGVKV